MSELQRLHSECAVYELIQENGFFTHNITESANISENSKGDSPSKLQSSKEKDLNSGKKAEVFAISASLIAAIAASYTFSVGDGLIAKLTTISIDKAAALGMVIAISAGFISGFVDWRKRK